MNEDGKRCMGICCLATLITMGILLMIMMITGLPVSYMIIGSQHLSDPCVTDLRWYENISLWLLVNGGAILFSIFLLPGITNYHHRLNGSRIESTQCTLGTLACIGMVVYITTITFYLLWTILGITIVAGNTCHHEMESVYNLALVAVIFNFLLFFPGTVCIVRYDQVAEKTTNFEL